MTKNDKQQILTKAIQKAIDGGWDKSLDDTITITRYGSVLDIIFNHQFAQALWGEVKQHKDEQGITSYDHTTGWKYHLRNMVIAEDPIEYLGQNL